MEKYMQNKEEKELKNFLSQVELGARRILREQNRKQSEDAKLVRKKVISQSLENRNTKANSSKKKKKNNLSVSPKKSLVSSSCGSIFPDVHRTNGINSIKTKKSSKKNDKSAASHLHRLTSNATYSSVHDSLRKSPFMASDKNDIKSPLADLLSHYDKQRPKKQQQNGNGGCCKSRKILSIKESPYLQLASKQRSPQKEGDRPPSDWTLEQLRIKYRCDIHFEENNHGYLQRETHFDDNDDDEESYQNYNHVHPMFKILKQMLQNENKRIKQYVTRQGIKEYHQEHLLGSLWKRYLRMLWELRVADGSKKTNMLQPKYDFEAKFDLASSEKGNRFQSSSYSQASFSLVSDDEVLMIGQSLSLHHSCLSFQLALSSFQENHINEKPISSNSLTKNQKQSSLSLYPGCTVFGKKGLWWKAKRRRQCKDTVDYDKSMFVFDNDGVDEQKDKQETTQAVVTFTKYRQHHESYTRISPSFNICATQLLALEMPILSQIYIAWENDSVMPSKPRPLSHHYHSKTLPTINPGWNTALVQKEALVSEIDTRMPPTIVSLDRTETDRDWRSLTSTIPANDNLVGGYYDQDVYFHRRGDDKFTKHFFRTKYISTIETYCDEDIPCHIFGVTEEKGVTFNETRFHEPKVYYYSDQYCIDNMNPPPTVLDYKARLIHQYANQDCIIRSNSSPTDNNTNICDVMRLEDNAVDNQEEKEDTNHVNSPSIFKMKMEQYSLSLVSRQTLKDYHKDREKEALKQYYDAKRKLIKDKIHKATIQCQSTKSAEEQSIIQNEIINHDTTNPYLRQNMKSKTDAKNKTSFGQELLSWSERLNRSVILSSQVIDGLKWDERLDVIEKRTFYHYPHDSDELPDLDESKRYRWKPPKKWHRKDEDNKDEQSVRSDDEKEVQEEESIERNIELIPFDNQKGIMNTRGYKWRKLPRAIIGGDFFQLAKHKTRVISGSMNESHERNDDDTPSTAFVPTLPSTKLLGLVNPANNIFSSQTREEERHDRQDTQVVSPFQTHPTSMFIQSILDDMNRLARNKEIQKKREELILQHDSNNNEDGESDDEIKRRNNLIVLKQIMKNQPCEFTTVEKDILNLNDNEKAEKDNTKSVELNLEDDVEFDNEEDQLGKAIVSVKGANYDALESTFEHGVHVDSTDEHGNTLFILACQQGNKKMAKFLLRRGANINAQNVSGNSCLHYLYEYGHEKLAEYLKRKGADDTYLNSEGLTCYEGVYLQNLDAL